MNNVIDYIYDLETYPNIITFCFLNTLTNEIFLFEISERKDQSKELLGFLRVLYKTKARMVGFNNLNFDYPLVHYFINNKGCTYTNIYNKAQKLISTHIEYSFSNIVKKSEVLIPQIDLFKIHHFDNKARATGLKALEFNMRSDNIEDLPFPPCTFLTWEQMDELIRYNIHDVKMTKDFYIHTLPMIAFREQLTEKYQRDFMNHNDTKIGKDYFIMRLEKEKKGSCYTYDDYNRRVINQTKRDSIKLNDCIFNYVRFQRPEFVAILNWIKSRVITETKGVFVDILEKDLGDVAQYAELVVKQKKLKSKPDEDTLKKLAEDNSKCWIEERELKSGKVVYYQCWRIAETLNVMINGFKFDFGTGGIHGSVENSIYNSNDEYEIIDADVKSMYPNLAISNRACPEHLGKLFCDIYTDMYKQRNSFAKGSIENAMLKLALNGVYGDSNSEFSPLYDPKFTMSITINGQLSLCMFVEQLLRIKNLKLIQCNTDGVTVLCPRRSRGDYDNICKWWQDTVKLELEYAEYNRMMIRDVNNYIAVYINGKLKCKGAYEHDDLEWHQDHSCLVIPKVVENHLMTGNDIPDLIRNHKDIMDFMLRVKVPRSSKLISEDDFGIIQQEQNTARYYVSNNGVKLTKVMPPLEGFKIMYLVRNNLGDEVLCKDDVEIKRYTKKGYQHIGEEEVPHPERHLSIESGYKVTLCNDMSKFNGDINYDYYIKEAIKLVENLKIVNY